MEGSQTLELVRNVEKCISNLGIMHRIFFREKAPNSLEKKILNNPGKYGEEKKIQDIIGIRVALYFLDDIAILREALEKRFTYVAKDSQIDEPISEVFKAVRCNLIFKLPESFDFTYSVNPELLPLIDNTFEVQIRTILSEGWHEIDHDLRYKCKDDWEGLDQENRAFNGVYATLETSEWTLLKLFENLAYTHYKNSNLRAMLTNKFRLRMKPSPLDESVLEYISGNRDLVKKIYRFSRTRILQCIAARKHTMPLSIASLIFLINLDSVRDPAIQEMTPASFERWWSSIS